MNARPGHTAMPRAQRGFVLILSLLMLIVLTLLGVSLLSGVTLQQKMSGNSREKARATSAASFALDAVQSQLTSQPLTAQSCASAASNGWRVCDTGTLTSSSAVQNSTWGLGGGATLGTPVTALPANAFSVSLLSTTGGSNVYYHVPEFIVQYQGQGVVPPGYSVQVSNYKSGSAPVIDNYLITTMGTGGNPSAVSVLQSLYTYMHLQ
ncbi:pilus assembly PilX family protein [Acidihalobacter ferrooxydans]|uniref:Type 4 fimbrial biogenesis protein PilX N-terminal domain-containing protein n=1 Tax=Acidihalobacter ferrooxydans TaxID=1765967 RepID=A0A1P8UJW2_9GAMM|nr:PilX N-terminal domain-containing pilus assembly protein [Acidihalobacter ferrooxydans]APZ44105.1 hypothetical protein BW247_14210 [Acidihalobacter ferrooxydans]